MEATTATAAAVLPRPFDTLELDDQEYRLILNRTTVEKGDTALSDLLIAFSDNPSHLVKILLDNTTDGERVLSVFGALRVLGVTDVDKLQRLYGDGSKFVTLDKECLLRLGYHGTHYEELKFDCTSQLNRHARMYVERRIRRHWTPTVSLYDLDDVIFDSSSSSEIKRLGKVLRFFIPVYTRYVRTFVRRCLRHRRDKKKEMQEEDAPRIYEIARYSNALLLENEQLREENAALKARIREMTEGQDMRETEMVKKI